jgi:quinol monooxygenase YgiN
VGVTAVVLMRAQPGREDAAAGALPGRLGEVTSWISARRTARLLQGSDDPGAFLYVGEWDDAAAFEAHFRTAWLPGLEDFQAAPPAVGLYRDLIRFERVGVPEPALGAAIWRTGPGAPPDFAERLVGELRRAFAGRPGLVSWGAYADLENPTRFAVLHGWESEASLRAFRSDRQLEVGPWARTHRATVDRFLGRVRAEVAR